MHTSNVGEIQMKGVTLRDMGLDISPPLQFRDPANRSPVSYWDQLNVCFSLCALETAVCGNEGTAIWQSL